MSGEVNLRRLLKEVYDGYSKVCFTELSFREDSFAYLKHPDFFDQNLLEEKYDDFFNSAKEKGALTKEDKLKALDELGTWTKKDESLYNKTSEYIKSLEKTKGKLFIQKQLQEIDKAIADETEKFLAMAMERFSSIGETCETYANKKRNDYSCKLLLFKDKLLKEHFLSDEDFDYLSPSDMSKIHCKINEANERISLENLKKLVCDNSFSNLFSLSSSSDPSSFFGRTPMFLSDAQSSLLILASTVKNIYHNRPETPKDIKDFDELIQYVESSEAKKKIIDKSKNNGSFSAVGMSKEDLSSLGIDNKTAISPFEKLRNSGKTKLGKEDFY